MSIRLKLLITYILCVLLSAGVLVVSIFIGAGKFITQVSDIILNEHAPDEIFVDLIDTMGDIKQVEKYEPENLINIEFIEDIDTRLAAINSSLVVVYEDQFYMVDEFPEETLRDKLFPRNLEVDSNGETKEGFHGRTHSSDENGRIVINDRTYIFIDFSFNLDEKKISYYVLTDISELENFNDQVKKGVGAAILILILILTLPLIILIQKTIIKPLKQLDKGAKQIGKGNLDFKLNSRSKDEMGAVIRSYERMRQELKKSIERQVQYEDNRKELISSISHDLKTPMTSIKGYVEGILDGVANTPEKQERYLRVVHQKSLDMDRMIDDLFTFSKLDLKKLPFEFTYVNMELLIRDYVQEVAMEYNGMGNISMVYKNLSDKVPLVKIDILQIRRVLQNLIQNAFKYNESDEKKVDIILENDIKTIKLSVKDNGIGMEEDELKQAFDIFYRSDASRNTRTGGSGLGLAIVKHIIDEHKGEIEAISAKGEGTKITIQLHKEDLHE